MVLWEQAIQRLLKGGEIQQEDTIHLLLMFSGLTIVWKYYAQIGDNYVCLLYCEWNGLIKILPIGGFIGTYPASSYWDVGEL